MQRDVQRHQCPHSSISSEIPHKHADQPFISTASNGCPCAVLPLCFFVCSYRLVDHRGCGDNQVEVVLPLQTFLDDLHVQETQETAPFRVVRAEDGCLSFRFDIENVFWRPKQPVSRMPRD